MLTISSEIRSAAIADIAKALRQNAGTVGGEPVLRTDSEYFRGTAKRVLDAAIKCALRASAPPEIALARKSAMMFGAGAKTSLSIERALVKLNAALGAYHRERMHFELTRCGVTRTNASRIVATLAAQSPRACVTIPI